jgi:hypothetical protein
MTNAGLERMDTQTGSPRINRRSKPYPFERTTRRLPCACSNGITAETRYLPVIEISFAEPFHAAA